MGKALKGCRNRVFLMTKVCTHGRDKDLALWMLDESLTRLQTDHLDLWQVHVVVLKTIQTCSSVPMAQLKPCKRPRKKAKFGSWGSLAISTPDIHLKMLDTGFPFDAVQMPLNLFDSSFRSFEQKVLPVLNRRGIAALALPSQRN
jgi:aryl-alcohol dehydrogenase-like predicted oxidoreductase